MLVKALTGLSCEIQWLYYLFYDLHVFLNPTYVHCDNQFAIYLAHNRMFHEYTKYIDIGCHLIHEKIQPDLIHLLLVSS